jgi:hypothetical protein
LVLAILFGIVVVIKHLLAVLKRAAAPKEKEKVWVIAVGRDQEKEKA